MIDPQPDLPLNSSHRKILGNVADAVMEYMETSRRSLEADRLTSLLTGLSTFVQGENGSDDSHLPARLGVDIQEQTKSQGHAPSSASPKTGHPDLGHPNSSTHAEDKPQGSSDFASISSTQGAPREKTGLSGNRPQTEVLCQRAADMMLHSLDLGSHGGVVIVGASQSSHHDFGENSEASQEHDSARVWALSQLEPGQGEVPDGQNFNAEDRMNSHFVRRMINFHPKGGLWYFQDDATLSSSDEDASGAESSKSSYQPSANVRPSSQSISPLRQKDLDALRRFFPAASRVIFCPLWDSIASRWFGACFCWSRAETRVFSTEVDLGGVLGFGSSLMIEYSRMRSQESSIKKDDFISTIS